MYNQLQSILFPEYQSQTLRLKNPNIVALTQMLQYIPQLNEITLNTPQFAENLPNFLVALKQSHPKLKKLCLPNAQLGQLDAKTLFQAIQYMESLEIFDISHIELSCAALIDIRMGLKSLSIKNSTLKDPEHLIEFFVQQRNLVHLDLSGTDLQGVGSDIVQLCIDLLARRAETVNLSYCGIKKKEVKAILPLVLNNSQILGFWLDGQITNIEQRQLDTVLVRNQRQCCLNSTEASYEQPKQVASPKPGVITIDDVQSAL